MKARVFVLAAGFAAAVFSAALVAPASVSAGSHTGCGNHSNLCRGENVSAVIEDGCIVFTDKESGETVEITEQAKLVVNGQSVRLNRGQRALVEEYHATLVDIVEEAKSIGAQGAKVGLHGAGLGLKAAIGVLMLLSPSYDSNDLEKDLEGNEEELERVASKLERRAERLEESVGKLERLHEDLRDNVHELDDLGWF